MRVVFLCFGWVWRGFEEAVQDKRRVGTAVAPPPEAPTNLEMDTLLDLAPPRSENLVTPDWIRKAVHNREDMRGTAFGSYSRGGCNFLFVHVRQQVPPRGMVSAGSAEQFAFACHWCVDG